MSSTPTSAIVKSTETDLVNIPLVGTLAKSFEVDPQTLITTMKRTCFRQKKKKDNDPAPPEVTNEQLLMLMVVAKQYQLNPFTRELYAFPSDGGITPIVGVDGWAKIINSRPEMDGVEFDYGPTIPAIPHATEPNAFITKPCPEWVECVIHIKGRTKPVRIREYLVECRRDTTPWTGMPFRMLRHKAFMQAGRIAFGLGGIFDEDEADDQVKTIPAVVTDPPEIKTGRLGRGEASTAEVDKQFGLTPEQMKPTADMRTAKQAEVYLMDENIRVSTVKTEPITEAKPLELPPDLKEVPKWMAEILDEINAVSSPTKCEVIGKRLMAEFRDENTSEPDKLQCYPHLFTAWAQKQSSLTPDSDRRRVMSIIENWQKYLGAIYPRVLEAFKK